MYPPQTQSHAQLFYLSSIELGSEASEDCGKFAWIQNIPESLQFAININQVFAEKDKSIFGAIRLKFWLGVNGIKLNIPIIKILKLKSDEEFSIWQLKEFDELIPIGLPISKLTDKQIELFFLVETFNETFNGSIQIFSDSGVLKSGMNSVIIQGGGGGERNGEKIRKMEKIIYERKSKVTPAWQVQLMKRRLREIKREFFEKDEGKFIINIIVPESSYPLKLNKSIAKDHSQGDNECTWDLNESKEESVIRKKFSKSIISNGDLRALKVIINSGNIEPTGISGVSGDNLLWKHREFLSKKYPTAIIPFIKSIQWWLSESDPSEIDEALRIIELWKLPRDQGSREEIGIILLVTMNEIPGLIDSKVWINLFKRIIFGFKNFHKFHSSIILFLRNENNEKNMKEFKKFIKEEILFFKPNFEIYWRLKPETFFQEFRSKVPLPLQQEISKQEKLFECFEKLIICAQKLKGNRQQKLEFIKAGLIDPETGIPNLVQQNPVLPCIGDIENDKMDLNSINCDNLDFDSVNRDTERVAEFNRVTAIVPERTHLFKSTSFTLLLLFLRPPPHPHPLPLILKRGDDLRKDSACLRLFRCIWDLWQKEGGLQLFPKRLLYGVTAVNEEFGMVEYIESIPLSKVISHDAREDDSHADWSIHHYLKELSDPESSRNFLSSCVGFSLLTYLLGIGDRHLDNLLLTPSGHLLHIDFSFVFGADPKPFPPPIKITREMVRAFCHDTDSEDKWNEFKGLCFTALSLLRPKSQLILSLIRCEYPSDPEALTFVKERLSIMLSQADALTKFDKLMEESRRAMFPQMMETIHKWVQYWKS